MTDRQLDDDRYIVKTFRVNEDELGTFERYRGRYGFATWSDFVRTALENFCHALEGDKLAWPKPTTSDKVDRLTDEREFDCDGER